MSEGKMKKYKKSESESQVVHEPAVAYQRSTDVNALKLRVVEGVMLINNVEKLQQLEDYVDDMRMPPEKRPCQFTLEELKAQIIQSEKDFENGDYYYYYYWEDIKAEVTSK